METDLQSKSMDWFYMIGVSVIIELNVTQSTNT